MANGVENIIDADAMAALERVHNFVDKNPESCQFLREIEIKFEKSDFGLSKVTFRSSSINPSSAAKRAWQAFKGNDEPVLDNASEGGFFPFLNGLAILLIECCTILDPAELEQNAGISGRQAISGIDRAKPDPTQKLLAIPDLGIDQSANLFYQLGSFATQRRTTRAKTEQGTYQLFWISSDRERMSNLDAYVGAGFLANGRLLDCFVCSEQGQIGENWYFFLPENRAPSKTALDLFFDIILKAPAIFDQKPLPGNQIIAAIITPINGTWHQEPHFLYLAGLRFYDESVFAPRWEEAQPFQVLSLEASAEEVKKLATRIHEAKPRIGYQVQLLELPYTEPSLLKIDRLRRQRYEIEERLADLEGFKTERPTLLRFNIAQLPVLADFIRYYKPDVLSQILYGCAHNDAQPSGYHFLYVRPQVRSMADLDPLIWWGHFGEGAMQFWLDPSWARSYAQKARSQVFVPHGLGLHPSLHSFSIEEMDDYLRQTFNQLARNQGIEMNIPDRPIYIFDGKGEPGTEISLSIIDFRSMVPLTTKLGWINTNLLLLSELGLEKMVEEMADSIRRNRLAESLSKSADSIEKEVNDQVVTIGQSWANSTNSMLEVITKEANQLVDSSKQFITKAQLLNKRLNALNQLYNDIIGMVSDTETKAEQVDQKEKALRNQYDGLAKNVRSAINEAEKTQQEWEVQLDATISRLTQSHDRLERKLNDLWRLGS